MTRKHDSEKLRKEIQRLRQVEIDSESVLCDTPDIAIEEARESIREAMDCVKRIPADYRTVAAALDRHLNCALNALTPTCVIEREL